MSVELNHTIVPVQDKRAAATFLAEILDLEVGEPVGPFVPVQLGNGVTLDYMNHERVSSQHYAFLVDDALFDSARKRLLDRGVQTWADPDHHEPDAINTRWDGRGLYFLDPDGHNMEILTRAPS
jgi:catechol 2,3-dioxygenase-like lactoylglutathione lyase family enzyme